MQMTDARRYQFCPTTGTAAHVKTSCIRRQCLPRKNRKILIEYFACLCVRQLRLIESTPLVAKTFDGVARKVFFDLTYAFAPDTTSDPAPAQATAIFLHATD